MFPENFTLSLHVLPPTLSIVVLFLNWVTATEVSTSFLLPSILYTRRGCLIFFVPLPKPRPQRFSLRRLWDQNGLTLDKVGKLEVLTFYYLKITNSVIQKQLNYTVVFLWLRSTIFVLFLLKVVRMLRSQKFIFFWYIHIKV